MTRFSFLFFLAYFGVFSSSVIGQTTTLEPVLSDSDEFALRLIYYNETSLEADISILDLDATLDAEITDTEKTVIVATDDSYALLSASTATGESTAPSTGESTTGTTAEVLTTMEAQRANVVEAAEKLLTLDGAVRESEIADWNANHERIKARLFELLEKEAENGLSDDLAPILEAIREKFQLQTPTEATTTTSSP